MQLEKCLRLGCPKIVVPVQVVYLGRKENTLGSEVGKENSQLRMFIKQLTTWAFKRNPTGKSLEATTKHMLLSYPTWGMSESKKYSPTKSHGWVIEDCS